MKQPLIPLSIFLLFAACGFAADDFTADDFIEKKTDWGSIYQIGPRQKIFDFAVTERPEDGRVAVPTPFPHVVWCTGGGNDVSGAIDFQFNKDASEIHVLLAEDQPPLFRAHTSEKSQQLPDGRIIFSALDAKVVGKTAKLEEHPGNYRIGFWSDAGDYVTWDYNATRWGMYRVLLTYSCASPDGSEVLVAMGDAHVHGKLKSTGSWYRYTTIDLGKLYVANAGKQTLTVKCTKKVGGAVMNLKAVLLIPACEGTPPVQADDGVVTLHARDATVQGTMLRWEPAEKKQTLGYWVRADDGARWNFTISKPGVFDVEVLQGCGTGQGESMMQIFDGDQEINWEVEETGHFQNFKPRVVGRMEFAEAGPTWLHVQPRKIAKNAACDIRQIRLMPVKE